MGIKEIDRRGCGTRGEESPLSAERHRFKVGAFECLVVSDGTFAYPHPAQFFFVNAPKERLDQALRGKNVDPERWGQYVSPYLCLVIDTGRQRVLVDTGAGGLAPTTGRLISNLEAEGIAPGDIDTVILTHGHPDHIGGNIDAEGEPAFPNARYVMWRGEWEFWTEPDLKELKIDEHIKEALINVARRNLPPIQGRLELVDREMEITPGIRAVAAAGHTPGQMALAVSSGDERLLCISDAAILPIHVEQPEWYSAVDLAPRQVVATRRRLLGMAEADGALVSAFHFPFPGLGHVVRKGEGWGWRPTSVG